MPYPQGDLFCLSLVCPGTVLGPIYFVACDKRVVGFIYTKQFSCRRPVVSLSYAAKSYCVNVHLGS